MRRKQRLGSWGRVRQWPHETVWLAVLPKATEDHAKVLVSIAWLAQDYPDAAAVFEDVVESCSMLANFDPDFVKTAIMELVDATVLPGELLNAGDDPEEVIMLADVYEEIALWVRDPEVDRLMREGTDPEFELVNRRCLYRAFGLPDPTPFAFSGESWTDVRRFKR